ncbi:hypothetical protein FRACYDRAFT_235648 [Fragilariopsis cylindrus CCMP1102]|uniref:Uncharacterized protein n=1 Tax=Fragilariopsis cylindrus CCMP1102 TaxID=635003 RepID=A0A1E7FN46_9STRA|nr:hypothetical protein FRACYDRAFT_235648 [Fragilariopsis cylindrus CCMP1102]|eukprot:OEU19589.1 hypothetical protein FRACYDRAFT_235648 [Fragilariopsis cylindrus CCMP1102]
MIRRKTTTKKERMNKAATPTDVPNTTAVVHIISSCSSIRSTNSVRFMEDTHTDDPLQRSAWKPTTSSHASIAPPVFINRRSSLDFNSNFIEHADENDNVDDKYDANNSNDNNGSVNVNDKGDCINIHTCNEHNQKTKSKKPLSLLRSIIKKGRNYHHGNKIIEKGSNNINNKRWTSMTTLTTASCSSPSRANSSPIKPPTYASRKSSLDFNKNFLDHKDIIQQPQQQQHGNTNGSNSNISIENGSSNANNNNNNERWTPTTTNSSSSSSSSQASSSIAAALSSQLPPTFARRRSSLDFNNNFIDRKDSMITHKNNNRKKSKNNLLSRSSIYNKKGGREGDRKNRHDNDNKNTNNIEEGIIVNENGNDNNDNDNDNQRWTPMSTTTTSSSSLPSSKASSIVASSSILPPTFVNRRSSLDFNRNFIDQDCFYIAK